MRILHTYCLNYNIGDYALGIGLKNLLRTYLDVDLIGETNIQGRVFDEYYINEVVNKHYDLLIIGGGGIIHGKHWPNGWFWLIDINLIKTIKIPFIVYAAGYNYWEEEGEIPERGIIHLSETMKYASYFSLRNDGSANRLIKKLGIHVPVVPDPGFHVNLGRKFERCIAEPYVIVQIANDKPEIRFGDTSRREKFVKEMKEVTSQLAKNYHVIYAPHVYADLLMCKEIISGISNSSIWDFGLFAFDRTYEAIAYYKYADFAISMRGHGQIIPICFNTPVIALENHPKHRGLMSELGLLDYNIQINDPRFKDMLFEKIDLVERNKNSVVRNYKEINSQLMSITDNSFKEILKQINL